MRRAIFILVVNSWPLSFSVRKCGDYFEHSPLRRILISQMTNKATPFLARFLPLFCSPGQHESLNDREEKIKLSVQLVEH